MLMNKSNRQAALKAGLILLTLLMCYMMLETSCINTQPIRLFQRLAGISGHFTMLNLLSLAAVFFMFWVLIPKVWLACFVMAGFCGILGVINHYVILFHTMPLSFMILRNFTTAMDAISSYTIKPDAISLRILAILAVNWGLCLCMKRYGKHSDHKTSRKAILLRNAVLVLYCIFFLYPCYFSEHPWSPRGSMGWSWIESYKQYGYVVSTFESLYKANHIVTKPEGYSESHMQNLEIADRINQDPATPDIILILNESFYDLRQITSIETDLPFLENIENMDNLLTGYTVVPGSGGTNNSEYELLTSNSMWLISGTPFNYLNMYGAESVVSHLNDLGYFTLGTHSEAGTNYSRLSGYQGLDFQKYYFEEHYLDTEFMTERWYETDASLYQNLIRWYETAPDTSPRFLYMLTIQNHGDWNRSAPEHDIVHTTKDYGNRTQDINEYLTGIYYSDQAFADLTEYFSQVDRPVIVCMMGDHGPSFLSEVADRTLSPEEWELRLRKCPLLIWANYPLETRDLGTISMNYVVPTLLEIAGVQLSPYYSYILDLKEQVPILSAYGKYYDAQGQSYSYGSDEGAAYQTLVDDYFRLEYHNIESSQNRDWFAPYGQ